MKGVLDIVHDPNFLSNLSIVEKEFVSQLESLKKFSVVKDIRVKGMLAAVDINHPIEWKKFYKKGLYLVAHANRIILAPPLIMTKNECHEAMSLIADVLKEESK